MYWTSLNNMKHKMKNCSRYEFGWKYLFFVFTNHKTIFDIILLNHIVSINFYISGKWWHVTFFQKKNIWIHITKCMSWIYCFFFKKKGFYDHEQKIMNLSHSFKQYPDEFGKQFTSCWLLTPMVVTIVAVFVVQWKFVHFVCYQIAIQRIA